MLPKDRIHYTLICNISPEQGRIQTEVEGGGNLERGRQNHSKKLARRRCAKIFGALFEKILWFYLLNNALVYMFRRIQNESLKKECIRVRIGALFLPKGGAKAEFSS